MSKHTKNQDIVIFSSDDWGWKTSKYQISTRLANYSKVLFVSSIGFRKVKASKDDFGRIIKKLKSFFNGVKKIDENLYVMTPIVIPGSSSKLINWLNHVVFNMQLFFTLRYLKIEKPIPLVFSQNWLSYLRNIKGVDKGKLVYYCVDEQSGFEGVNAQKFIEDDIELTKLASQVYCSARSLYEKMSVHNKNTHYFPHGVDYGLFNKALQENIQKPKDIYEISGPVLLFFGHISYDWVDIDLLTYIAKKRSEWNILLLGRISVDEKFINDFDNIYYLGEKEINELAAYCAYSDVGLIPFVNSKLTMNCNPLKLPEYLSAGLPVVSTYIPEVCSEEYTCVANSYEEFLACCDDALRTNSNELKHTRSGSMKARSWDYKVEQLYKQIS